MGLQEFSGHLAMTDISEDLADVVAEGRQHQLVVSGRSFRTSCGLQSVFQLADLSAIAYVRKLVRLASTRSARRPSRPMRSMQRRIRG